MEHSFNNFILFDGICNLCNNTVKFIIKRDKNKKFKFASLQSKVGEELLRKYGLSSDYKSSVVYIRQKKMLRESSAMLYILNDIGGIWKLFFVFIIVPKFIRDFVYKIIANNRYRIWGKKETCDIRKCNSSDYFIE